MTRIIIVALMTTIISACDESTEEAFQRGYEIGVEDGVNEVCYEVEKISFRFHERLQLERVC